MKNLTSKI